MNEPIVAQMIETLNRIEGKVDKNTEEFRQQLCRHMKDEEKVIKELSDRVVEYTRRAAAVETAFLRTHDGKIDYHGHREDHYTRKKLSQWLNSTRSDTLKHLLELAFITFVIWLSYTLWKVFLRGPE